MTATTQHYRPTQSRSLLTFGLPAVIGVALFACAGLGRADVATAEPPVCRTDPSTSPIPVNAPFIYERGLHRVNSPVPGPAVPAPVANVIRN